MQSCNECKKPDALWNTSNEIWQKITSEKEGILCPSCFDKKASEMGIVLWWECSLDGYPSKKAHKAAIARAVKDVEDKLAEARKTFNENHPTEKSVALMSRVIEWTRGTVFDPFMGSGTTGVACTTLGRKFIGIEISEKYFDIACKRIDQAERQGQLFKDPGITLDRSDLR